MKLNERVAIITEENISRLSHLYGEIDIDDLSRIVNSHLKDAINEIEEDCLKQKEHNCAECEFMKKYDYSKKIYYCDHPGIIDDIGKLSMEIPPKTSPVWCPIRCKQGNDEIKKCMYNSMLGFVDTSNNCVFPVKPIGLLLQTAKDDKHTNTGDLIQMNTDFVLTDNEGKAIDVKVPEPEYMCEIFGKI